MILNVFSLKSWRDAVELVDCRKVRMPEDDLADNFDGYAGSGCKGCRMPPQVMRTKVDAYQLPCFQYDHPRRLVGNGENTVFGIFTGLFGIITETLRYLLRYEDNFPILPAFWRLEDQFLILNVFQTQFQYLSNPHSAARHQFEHLTVANFFGTEYNLVNNFLFDDFPPRCYFLAVDFPDHGRVTWIY